MDSSVVHQQFELIFSLQSSHPLPSSTSFLPKLPSLNVLAAQAPAKKKKKKMANTKSALGNQIILSSEFVLGRYGESLAGKTSPSHFSSSTILKHVTRMY